MRCLTLNRAGLSPVLQNVIKNAKISGNIRRTSWLYNRALKGFFNVVPKNDVDKATLFANQLDSMITVLNGQLGENWDFHLSPTFKEKYNEEVEDYYNSFNGFSLYIVLRFPEIEITNSEGKSHNIKDLFVSLEVIRNPLDTSYLSIESIDGTKGTYSFEEWFVGYVQSHLRPNKPSSFDDVLRLQDFCLGSGTEIIQQRENLMTEYSAQSFEMLILIIDAMVRWESLEGVPYIKISKIGVGEEQRQADENRGYSQYYRRVRELINEFNVDFVLNDNRYRIKQNEKFERLIHSKIKTRNNAGVNKNLLVNKIGTKYYGYTFPDITSEDSLKEMFKNRKGELPFYYHRNQKIVFNVEPYSGTLPNIDDYKVHPKFLNYAATRLEQELHHKTVRKSTIEEYCQGANA